MLLAAHSGPKTVSMAMRTHKKNTIQSRYYAVLLTFLHIYLLVMILIALLTTRLDHPRYVDELSCLVGYLASRPLRN